jgi:hypothetical protein
MSSTQLTVSRNEGFMVSLLLIWPDDELGPRGHHRKLSPQLPERQGWFGEVLVRVQQVESNGFAPKAAGRES